MFPDVKCDPVPYTDPWVASYDQRLRALVRRSRHIAYVYEIPEASSFRYRVFNMVEALEAAAGLDISAAWFTQADLRGDLRFVDRADAIVICRTRYDHDVARLLARANARGIRVVFDIDDLVFNSDYVPLVAHTLDRRRPTDEDWNYLFGYVSRLGATLKSCDAVIAATAPLAECVRAFSGNDDVTVLPNFLNRRQVEISQTLIARKRHGGYRREAPLVIGYFSGSPTHNRDLQVAAPALAQILAKHAEVLLRIVGYIELNEVLDPFRSQIDLVEVQDFVNLQRVIAEGELNIVPLQSNVFTDCKSELKYFEAAAVGVVTIASPTTPLIKVITDGVNGYIARPHEWEAKIAAVIEMLQAEPTAYQLVAEEAAEDALSRYGWDRQARSIEAAVFGGAAGSSG